MAVGKNKRISKGRKGAKKKIFDPFTKKDWYDIKAPAPFTNKNVGKTIVSRTVGTKIASDGLKHRVVPVNLADLNSDESHAHVNFKLRIEDIQGTNCLTNFWGMCLTTDKLRFLVKKWQTLIESHSDVKTTDGYHLRLFIIGFTKKLHNQRKTFYAQTAQVKQIRKKMMDITVKESTTCTLKELVEKLIPNGIGKLIEKECHGIYPIQNVYVRKVKVLKAPKFDAYKLLELHGETVAQAAKEAEKPKKEAPKKEAPKKEAKKAAPKKEAKKEAPKKEAPKKEAKPKAEETGTKVERPQKK